ncbi:preprotein translocase subunit SecA [Candidatus Adlerbacteria bacterium RIFCSPLOWO2_01_FULL_54_21b]|uniref:Protein translocase subunit SecA n=2 Tax=Candidatus Adleribacteriota TaxID=1752736 RepID=A0A1F4Y0M6_9BACT|nr:MAG: preprotein translocase subunit SecA [Candidatus Adlerbacteria bacterium RIFCSPLOWO2_01_FULL_54_21b]
MFSLRSIFGDPGQKIMARSHSVVERVNALSAQYEGFTNAELAAKTAAFRARLMAGESEETLLPEAFAAAREAARRTVKLRPFDVQLVGGLVLNNRGIAEMKTGEGKTLVATLPAYLNALHGKGVHIVTVNDYLARRDAVWMGQIYATLGMSVGVINQDASYLYDVGHMDEDKKRDEEGSFKIFYDFLRPCTRREAYEADITYGTNSEFGFDYLRDNISYSESELRQRGHYFAIIDEIDSILIDEARTPLIISAPAAESDDLYRVMTRVAATLVQEADYTVDEKRKAIQLTDEGITKAEKMLGIENIYTEGGIKYVHHLETAVRAKALFHKDKEYVVKGGEVVIVDEFTGRLQPGRRWSEGLHQAIESKEGVAVQKESRTFASITYQNYFRLYERLAGMTGTAKTSSEEFYKVYGLEVVEVPTNRPVVRNDHNDLIFQTETGKFKALARAVKELHKKGQPVLIGTVSIEKNELLSNYLRSEGVPHEMLNAKNHEREGEIVASAGQAGRVTVATNMAGRGVDIKLGGALATTEQYEAVKAFGGLFVIGTERHEARRIDNQLRGRSGRQGDPGETQFFVSLEDQLMRIFAPDSIKGLMGRFGIPEDEPIENRLVSRALESAQTKIEGFNFDARKHVLEFDNVLDKQRRAVYERRRTIVVGTKEEIAGVIGELAGESTEAKVLLTKKEEELGAEQFFAAARGILLQGLDLLWVEHLESMEYLRGSVNLRAYGQRDPLTEYRREGTRIYKEMEEVFRGNVFEMLERLTKDRQPSGVAAPAPVITLSAPPEGGSEIGRNDPCPCSSGKKWKNCGLKNTEEHQRLMEAKK